MLPLGAECFWEPSRPTASGTALRLAAPFVLVVVLAVVAVSELNRPDVTGANPEPPELVCSGAHGIASRINRLTGRQQGKMAVARPAVIREGA